MYPPGHIRPICASCPSFLFCRRPLLAASELMISRTRPLLPSSCLASGPPNNALPLSSREPLPHANSDSGASFSSRQERGDCAAMGHKASSSVHRSRYAYAELPSLWTVTGPGLHSNTVWHQIVALIKWPIFAY
ncbi:hypothetical protein H1C71_027083 [Ictidomys tridecemlineatus]|nr:hypothetical protein H1C71_027083 [Ictidomys tridecemlineatus]KAG3290629.1 hypothetical protein H1C71_027083 [Ictidomys tridecemlineatus]